MITKVLHYELPYETGVSNQWKTFCGKLVLFKELAATQERITCLICRRELEKHNNEVNI